MEYSIDKLNELIEMCKADPRDFKITRKTVKLYNFNEKNILPYLTQDQNIELLQETFLLIKEDIYIDGNIEIFFKYLYLYNGYDTRQYFMMINLLELMKKRFNTKLMMSWIYDVSTYYASYIENVNKFHEDLSKIYDIKERNRFSYETGLEELAGLFDVNEYLFRYSCFINPLEASSDDSSNLINDIRMFLSKKNYKIKLNLKDIVLSHLVIPSSFYYIAREIVKEERKSEFIERMISGLEEIIKSYFDNIDKFNKISFLRIVTLISAKNGLKLKYNEDNHIYNTEEILHDYTNDLAFIYNNNIYQSGIAIAIKLLQEINVLQMIYNYYGIKENLLEQFIDVSLFLLSATKDIILIQRKSKNFDIKTFLIEAAIPLTGITAFYTEEAAFHYDIYSTALNNYYNIFNDREAKRTPEKRDFNFDYVYI